MKLHKSQLATAVLALLLQACSDGSNTTTNDQAALDLDPNSGGATTIQSTGGDAFSTISPGLSAAEIAKHDAGDEDFEVAFVAAGAGNQNGLGPVFNHSSCDACHTEDGRGRPPVEGESVMDTMFLRVSIGNDPVNGPIAAPGMGGQLQHRAIAGVAPEADAHVSYTELPGQFDDGTPYSLRVPSYRIDNLADPGALATAGVTVEQLLLSPRIGPPVFGRGLLEAIPEATIVALADENDADGDGISGKVNRVKDPISGNTVLGRFGLKANNPSLLVQNAGAYVEDMGITNAVFQNDPAKGQVQDDGRADDPELGFNHSTGTADVARSQEILDNVTFYTATLGVPARRDVDNATVQQGQRLFASAGCDSCHTPTLQTGPSDTDVLANQTIHPYSDMLLHDMGDSIGGVGLADGRPDFLADGNEWRTPPLWGIGLTGAVNGHTFFLHDGRARNISEAILWHGGEGDKARKAYLAMSADERNALLAFVNSL